MDQNLPMRKRASDTLVQEETQSRVANKFEEIEEEKQVQEGVNGSIEEDVIIKCGLDEMVKRFFKDYVIVWHDPNVGSEENKQYIVQLEKFCEVKTFTEWEKAALCIQETKAYCHVITSGTNGELLINEINQSPKVSAIYVFCMNSDYHEPWAKVNQKISCVETQIKAILDKIEENLLKWYKKESNLKMNLPAFAPVFTDWDKSGMNNLHRYLKVIPNFKNRSQAKNDLLSLSRAIYSDKMNRSFMAEFEKNYNEYNKEAILKWYTQESFVLKVTNNCLRIASSDSIQYCRLLLKDLERAIREQYQEKSKHFHGLLFRGASLSDEEWLNLKANLNREIEMHGFLSVSKDKNQALKFIELDSSKNVFISILVPKGPNDEEQGFAEVEEFSRFPQEKEILFNVRSRFTVLEAEDKYSEDLPSRHLVLFYGAQGFRKYLAEKNYVQEILIPNNENISCSLCQGKISQNMFFTPISTDKDQSFFCKKCLPDFLRANNAPLFCIPQGNLVQQIKLQGILMTCPMKSEIPMYGYQCCKCQIKKQEIYYQCTECCHETKKIWCESCTESSLECMQEGHSIILESHPFSFWCDKMFQKDLDHLKFQNEILEESDEFQQAEMFLKSHEYQKAIQYYKIYIQQNCDKNTDFNLVRASISLALVYDSQAEYKKALQALEISKSFCDNENPNFASSLSNLKDFCLIQKDHKKALEISSRGLDVLKSYYGNNDPNVASGYNQMGDVYYRQGECKKALEHYSQALEIFKSFYGKNHPTVANSLNNFGVIYDRQKEYKKALEHYSQSLEIFKSLHGNNHPNVANSLNNIGVVYYRKGEYKKALEHYFQSLEIRKLSVGNQLDLAADYENLAAVFYRQAEYQKSVEFFEKALTLYESLLERTHSKIVEIRSSIGKAHSFLGDQNKALQYHLEALDLKNRDDSEKAWIYCNIGDVFNNLGQHIEALNYFSKSLALQKSLLPGNHSDVADSYCGLGKAHLSLQEYGIALEYYLKSLEMRKSIFHENHPEVATSYYDIADTFKSQRKYKEAQEYYLKSLEIRKQVFGEDHSFVTAVSDQMRELLRIEDAEKKNLFNHID